MEIIEENKLEELLRLAADEPAHRPEFCETLLNSNVFLLGATEQVEAYGHNNLEAGSHIQIQHWQRADGLSVIPFFSSLEVLQKSIDTEQSYLMLPARSLFEMTQGATLFLNPKSKYGKEFLPQEVAHLLTTGISQSPVQRVVEEETKVLLGEPANYPHKMIDSLTQLFAKHRNVNSAYLALMHDKSVDEKPHLIIGIETNGDAKKVITEAGSVAIDTLPKGESIDFYQIKENDSGLSEFLLTQIKPFYEKRWGTKLCSTLGSGNA